MASLFFVFFAILIILAIAIVASFFWVPSNADTPQILLYAATFGDTQGHLLIAPDEIAYVEIGNKITFTISFSWNVTSYPFVSPLVFSLPTPNPTNLTVAFVSTNISLPSGYTMILGGLYDANHIGFVFSNNGAPSTFYVTGLDVVPNTTQFLGFVVTYTK